MIQEIENRRSIRKYKADKINKELIEDMIYSATLAPSAKNRQPWKFIVYQGKEKEKLVDVMLQGINSEKITHALMKEWAFAIPDAENTVRIMEEAPCLIAVLNTNQKTPFEGIENEKRIVEICNSLLDLQMKLQLKDHGSHSQILLNTDKYICTSPFLSMI